MNNPNQAEPDFLADGRLSRRNIMLGGGLGAIALAGMVLAAPGTAQASENIQRPTKVPGRGPGPMPASFVQVKGGEFARDGRPWRFGGTNCYYLHASSHYMIDSMLNNAAVMKMQVVRAWAFNDDPNQSNALQPAPYTYPEDNYDSLDYTVYKAGQLGLKLVLPLVNNWPDYGGMKQYVSWFLGLPDDSYGDGINHDRFYTDDKIRKCYLAYADHVINRKNRYTGLRYRDDPTIMTWELANEPRNRSDKSGAPVLAWADAVSRHLKTSAPRQLVAIGDEGMGMERAGSSDYPYSNYEGNRWLDLTRLPAVDYGTVHLYPFGWGEVPSNGVDPVAWGKQWIADHIAAGKKLGKPVVLEEFGLQIDATKGVPSESARDAGYDAWLTTVESSQGAGTQFWILTALTDAGINYPDYDGFRIVYPSSTANLFTKHAVQLAATVSS